MKLIPLFLLLPALAQAQTALKQSELLNFYLGHGIEAGQPVHVTHLDSTDLAEGSYAVTMDREGRAAASIVAHFRTDAQGRINGPVQLAGSNPAYHFDILYHNDTLVRFNRDRNGHRELRNRLENGIVYQQEFDETGMLKEETRYKNGKSFYSIQTMENETTIEDKTAGITTTYKKGTQVMVQRIWIKDLPDSAVLVQEDYDARGKLRQKEIRYEDHHKKTIYADGSYEINAYTDQGEKITQYNKAGKVLKSYYVAVPVGF